VPVREITAPEEKLMKTRAATEYALLGVLRGGARHGYEIRHYIEVHLGSTWYVSTSQLYALLKRLEGLGWLQSCVEIQQTRPSKRIFSLTPQGRKAFDAWVLSPAKHVRDLRVEFLAKLFFIKNLRLQGGGALVESQVDVLNSLKEKQVDMQKRVQDGFQKLVLDARIANIECWIVWLRKKANKFVSVK